ncbi:MAG: endolytic transglycosylase MltG [Luminiphilus sp.]|nr:endolytic transglycosylase MltG [Luminiphilus sp.]
MTKRVLLLTLMLTAMAVGAGMLRLTTAWNQALVLPPEGVLITVAQGESLSRVLARAENNQWLMRSSWVGVVARWHGLDERIQAGEFALKTPLTAGEFIAKLAAGEVVRRSVTLPEGITLAQAIEILHRESTLIKTPLDELSIALLAMTGREDSAEGLFLPETWSYTRGDSDLDILQRSHLAMNELLTLLWERRPEGLVLSSPYAALTLASIVEKETGVAGERMQIAGVFLRRLERGMRLQTDPTVIYGLGDDYDGDLKRRHLRDNTNPYNTYAIQGLPPTPIALPGEAALRAVFSPADGEALYFVAKGDGSHAFSATLEEHEENVQRYQLTRRADYRSSPDISNEQ